SAPRLQTLAAVVSVSASVRAPAKAANSSRRAGVRDSDRSYELPPKRAKSSDRPARPALAGDTPNTHADRVAPVRPDPSRQARRLNGCSENPETPRHRADTRQPNCRRNVAHRADARSIVRAGR